MKKIKIWIPYHLRKFHKAYIDIDHWHRSLVPAWMIIKWFFFDNFIHFFWYFFTRCTQKIFYQNLIWFWQTMFISILDHGVSNNNRFFLLMVGFIWLFIFIIQCFFCKCYVLIAISVPLLRCPLLLCVIQVLYDTVFISYLLFEFCFASL